MSSPTPTHWPSLALVLAATGCIPDGWAVVPARDASAEAALPDTAVFDTVADAACTCTHDGGGACGDRSGLPRCGVTCDEGPSHLYRGEGDGRDGVGAQHATQNNADFADGHVGQAFAFGGGRAQQYVTLPPGVLDFGDGDFTVSLWFASTQNGNLLSKRASCWGGPRSTGLDLRLTYAGELIVELWTTTGFFSYRTSPGLNDGRWHHVVLVRDGATWSLHLDGVAVATDTINGAFRDPTDTPVYLGVGRCVAGAPGSNGTQDGSTWLDGRIDEVAMLPRALSASELRAVVQGRCAL